MTTPTTAWYVIELCESCVNGADDLRCDTPGCALIFSRRPSLPLNTELSCIKMTEQEMAAFNAAVDFARGEL